MLVTIFRFVVSSAAQSARDLALVGCAMVVLAALIPAAIIWGMQPQRRRYRQLLEQYPDAFVEPMAPVDHFTDRLRLTGFSDRRPKMDFIVVVQNAEIQFWQGIRRPMLRFTIPASAVSEVRIGLAQMDRATAKVVGLRIDSASDHGKLWLPMMPEKLGKRFGMVPPTGAEVTAVAEVLRSRLEEETGLALPAVTWNEDDWGDAAMAS